MAEINIMPGRKPNKKELARMKIMSELGVSPTAIAEKMGRSHHTVIKYLQSDVYTDPSIGEIIERIKEKETQDLWLLGAKGRQRLHELLDEGKAQMIPTIALVDRTFQQRRLLEGKSTINLSLKSQLVEAAHRQNDTQNDTRVKKQEDKEGS